MSSKQMSRSSSEVVERAQRRYANRLFSWTTDFPGCRSRSRWHLNGATSNLITHVCSLCLSLAHSCPYAFLVRSCFWQGWSSSEPKLCDTARDVLALWQCQRYYQTDSNISFKRSERNKTKTPKPFNKTTPKFFTLKSNEENMLWLSITVTV